MKDTLRLVKLFRKAIEKARDEGEFERDISFCNFPQGCCGDACDLLAQFLLDQGISTFTVCGAYNEGPFENHWTHAWLQTKNQILLDITGDQFKYYSYLFNYDKAVYVGEEDNFHRLFDVDDRDVYENTGINNLGIFCQPRLTNLYKKIIKYI